MNILTHHTFENYINNVNKFNLHSKKHEIYDVLPENFDEIPHLILYGKEGIGKYSQALYFIKNFSDSELKYERNIGDITREFILYDTEFNNLYSSIENKNLRIISAHENQTKGSKILNLEIFIKNKALLIFSKIVLNTKAN